MTSLDDSLILTCIYILGAEYTWIKSEFLKYKNILSESKWYIHIELRLHNTKLYLEVNLLFHFLYRFSFGLVLYYTNSPLIPHDIILKPLLEHLAELLSLYWIINRLSKMVPQCFNQSLYPTLLELSLPLFFFFWFSLCPTGMPASFLHPTPSKVCLNYNLQSLFYLATWKLIIYLL